MRRAGLLVAVLLFCVAVRGQGPAARSFQDARYHVSFQAPAGWNLTQKDGEVSTFRLDARSAMARTQMRAVASIGFNPFPASTFSGALVYFSVQPGTGMAACAAMVGAPLKKPTSVVTIGGASYTHGHDEHGKACVESRDEVYTTERAGACYRFDLVVNTFCSDTSASRDMTQAEMDGIHKQMESVLLSVKFDGK